MTDIRPDRLTTCQSERKSVVSRRPSVVVETGRHTLSCEMSEKTWGAPFMPDILMKSFGNPAIDFAVCGKWLRRWERVTLSRTLPTFSSFTLKATTERITCVCRSVSEPVSGAGCKLSKSNISGESPDSCLRQSQHTATFENGLPLAALKGLSDVLRGFISDAKTTGFPSLQMHILASYCLYLA
jgi:hypothetical protein